MPLNLGMRNAVVCLILFWLLGGCSDDPISGNKIFRYNEFNGITTLDPAFARSQSVMWAVHQLYSTLVEVNDSLQIKPLLATHWEFKNNNTELIFHLREDIWFHDDPCFPNSKGRRMLAEDVVYSLRRIADPKVASPGAWIFNGKLDTLNGITSLDEHTVSIRLLKPFQPILGTLTMPYCSIVPHEAVETYGPDFRRHPVGTGPFQMLAWEEGQALVMKRNPTYFESDQQGKRLPYLQGIRVSFLDSRATEFLELQSGRLDFINDVDPSFKDEVLTRTGKLKSKWEGKLVMQKHPYLNIEYLGILTDSLNPIIRNSPLRHKAFRLAINYAINKKRMMLYLRNSIGTAANSGFIPPGLPAFDSAKLKGPEYNPEKAKQLLISIGYEASANSPITLVTVPAYSNLASYVVSDLQQCGINAKIEIVQKSLLLQKMAKSDVAFFRGSWIADYPDAENYLSVFYGKNPAPPNYTRFKNKTYDALYERAISEQDKIKRITLYRQMDSLVVAESPVIPLWYDEVIRLVNPRVKGFPPNSLNMLELRMVKKD